MRKLYPYQREAARFLYQHSKAALFAGVGSGKTATMLFVLKRLLEEGAIENALVVAPVAVCKSVWSQEAEKWPQLHGLRFSHVIGTPEQRELALIEIADIYLINYENLTWLMNEMEFDFKVLVLDESTKLKNHASVRFKGKKNVVGLKKFVHKFSHVYLMTGTPKPSGYIGLWSQIYMLDGGKRLGKNITTFKKKYYYQYGPSFYQIEIRGEEQEKEIRSKLKSICHHIPRKVIAAALPGVRELTYTVELPRKARKMYGELKEDFFIEIEDQPITVENIAILSNKLQQVCQGAIYNDAGDAKQIHNEKLDMLDALVEDLGDRRALVIFSYKHDLERLLKWHKAPLLKSGLAGYNKLIDEWNAGEHDLLYGHPASCGHGLNLQGGAYDIIFFGLHWSLELYQQTIGRLRRTGQKADTVFVHRIACSDTIETELMLPRLKRRSESQRQFLDSFKRWCYER